MTDDPWAERAACKNCTDTFFSDEAIDIARAKAICARCPVIAECAKAGQLERWGIWGGKTPAERGVRSPGKRMPVGPKPCKGGCGLIVPAGRVKFCEPCADVRREEVKRARAVDSPLLLQP